jgi:hypothetical protein
MLAVCDDNMIVKASTRTSKWQLDIEVLDLQTVNDNILAKNLVLLAVNDNILAKS